MSQSQIPPTPPTPIAPPTPQPTSRMTAPVMPSVSPQLVSFTPTKKSFVLHNARPKRIETIFNSNMMTLPAVNEIHPIKHEKDADGDPIPGTYVVEDIYTYVEKLNTSVMTFDAERAVIRLLGIVAAPDGSIHELSSNIAINGVSLLPRRPTKEQWQEVAKAGEHRAFLALVRQAQYELEAHAIANATRVKEGMPTVSGGPMIEYYTKIVEQYNSLAKEQAKINLAPYREQEMTEQAESDLEFEIFMKAKVAAMVDRAAEQNKIDKTKFFDELMQDPQIRKHAMRAWRFRRKGHLPEDMVGDDGGDGDDE